MGLRLRNVEFETVVEQEELLGMRRKCRGAVEEPLIDLRAQTGSSG